MKVLLFDVDSKIPNLALMKLSAYHKARGDQAGFDISTPDIVYASVVFKKNRHLTDGLKFIYPNADIRLGGSGNDLKLALPDEIEFIKPDYTLYPDQSYSMGFTTRGCIRNCHFCIVPEKEGNLKIWQHPSEFHDWRFDTIMLLDNNWLADQEWFFQTSGWIRSQNLKVIEGGMDYRLLDEGLALRLSMLKWAKPMHFAFDHDRDQQAVTDGITLLKKVGVNVRQNVLTYVYLHDSSDKAIESAKARCRYLKELGTTPFLMFNIDNTPSKAVKQLRRWANRPWLFWTIDIDDYDPKKEHS